MNVMDNITEEELRKFSIQKLKIIKQNLIKTQKKREELKLKQKRLLESHHKLGDVLIHLAVKALDSMNTKISNTCPHCKKKYISNSPIHEQMNPESIIEAIRAGVNIQQSGLNLSQNVIESFSKVLGEEK